MGIRYICTYMHAEEWDGAGELSRTDTPAGMAVK